MPSMKIITLITLVLMLSVALLHNISFLTKVIIDLLLFAGWVLFAIIRVAAERRRIRRERADTAA